MRAMSWVETHTRRCKVCGDGRGFLCQQGVLSLTQMSLVTLRRLENAGRFPRHVRFGLRKSYWVESEVREWIAARMEERDVEASK